MRIAIAGRLGRLLKDSEADNVVPIAGTPDGHGADVDMYLREVRRRDTPEVDHSRPSKGFPLLGGRPEDSEGSKQSGLDLQNPLTRKAVGRDVDQSTMGDQCGVLFSGKGWHDTCKGQVSAFRCRKLAFSPS